MPKASTSKRKITEPSTSTCTTRRPRDSRRRVDVSPCTVGGSGPNTNSGQGQELHAKVVPLPFRAFHAQLFEPVPAAFSLAQTICSYGYFQLSPNTWVPAPEDADENEGFFCRPLVIPAATSAVEEADEVEARRAARRILRLEQEEGMRRWFALHAEAAARGFGRTYRSPTVFEDMVKTITNCNIKFSGTIRMNRLLCEYYGRQGAFPRPCDLHEISVDDLRVNAKVGYRAGRIIRLAKAFVLGDLSEEWFDDSSQPSDEVYKKLLALHGFGPFAASNVMQLLGCYDCKSLVEPFDSETVRLMKELGIKCASQAEYFLAARQRYKAYAPYQFLAYWFELWKNYEKRAGNKLSTWWTAKAFNDAL